MRKRNERKIANEILKDSDSDEDSHEGEGQEQATQISPSAD